MINNTTLLLLMICILFFSCCSSENSKLCEVTVATKHVYIVEGNDYIPLKFLDTSLNKKEYMGYDYVLVTRSADDTYRVPLICYKRSLAGGGGSRYDLWPVIGFIGVGSEELCISPEITDERYLLLRVPFDTDDTWRLFDVAANISNGNIVVPKLDSLSLLNEEPFGEQILQSVEEAIEIRSKVRSND